MALTGDQRALLKLIVERGQSYEDIASLLGSDATVVRSRARRALAALAGADLDRSANVTDYLLGQADPIARADAVRQLSRDPGDRDRAEGALLALQAIAPNASLPELPEARQARPKRATEPSPPRSARVGQPLATPQRRLVALIGALGLAVIVAVIAIAGGDSDDNGGSDGPIDPDFVRVELRSAAGAKGSGVAVIGQTDDDQPFIELDLEGMGNIGPNSNYVLWMLTDDRQGIPVAPIGVEDGEFHDRMPLLSPADLVAAFSKSIVVSVMSAEQLRESLEGLFQNVTDADEDDEAQLPVARYRARTILRGQIPTLAELTEQAEAEAGGGAAGQGGGGAGAGEAEGTTTPDE